MGLLDVPGPYRRRKAVLGQVSLLYGLVYVLKGDGGDHRAEDFFPGNLHVIFHVVKDGGLYEVALTAQAFATAGQLRTFLLSHLNVTHNLVELVLRDHRPHLGPGV